MKVAISILIGFLLALNPLNASAQLFKSVKSYVHFFSSAPLENIEAVNNAAQSALNPENGEIVFSVPIKEFIFQKSLMQEHFNENYMESDKYPAATFRGFVSGIDPDKTSWQEVTARGKLTIHGVERESTVTGKIQVNSGMVELEALFPVRLADHKIKIPKVVFYNIAEVVDVTIRFTYEQVQ